MLILRDRNEKGFSFADHSINQFPLQLRIKIFFKFIANKGSGVHVKKREYTDYLNDILAATTDVASFIKGMRYKEFILDRKTLVLAVPTGFEPVF